MSITSSSVEPAGAPQSPQNPVTGPKLRKLVVAVHGIGRQHRFATIQSVIGRFGIYCNCPGAVPLGSFHSDCQHGITALRNPSPPYPENYPAGLHDIGFSEMFWADIPNEAVTAGDTLEETKAWAQSVVERVRALDRRAHRNDSVDYEKTSIVISEMIDTIGVLETLLAFTRKCGLGGFDLQQVLTDYVGDIQIVTEFSNYRSRIFNQFHSVLRELCRRHDPDEIHIIAHSEGTVIAFLGLLQALSTSAPAGSEWVDRVSGFMTLGSPIDKHLVMWPSLWLGLEPSPARIRSRSRPIDWRNYYDFGDPVGFKLDTARDWLMSGGWMGKKPGDAALFHFPDDPEHDCGFSRYLLPGKAHNDYWGDDALFRHFIANVVDRPSAPSTPPQRLPRSSMVARLFSRVVPYVICFAILLVGTYVLYKPVSQFVSADQATDVIARNVFAIASILAGLTVLARVPRIARNVWNYAAAIFAFLVSVLLYHWAIEPGASTLLGLFFEQHFGWPAERALVWVLAAAGLIAAGISYAFPGTGLKGIVTLVAIVALAVVWGIVTGPGKLPGSAERPAIWPVALAGGVFLYCWWLSALLFDLVFVWHRYIRSSRAIRFLRTCNKCGTESTKENQAYAGDIAAARVGGAL